MAELFLTLLIIASVFAALVVFGGRFIVQRIGNALEQRQEASDWILSTGLAPPSWYMPYQKRIDLLRRLGLGESGVAWVQDRYKRRLERRLRGMLRYVEASNVISDDAIRRTMASTIRSIGRSWEESTWQAVTSQAQEN